MRRMRRSGGGRVRDRGQRDTHGKDGSGCECECECECQVMAGSERETKFVFFKDASRFFFSIGSDHESISIYIYIYIAIDRRRTISTCTNITLFLTPKGPNDPGANPSFGRRLGDTPQYESP